MKILYVTDCALPSNGCWFYRNYLPAKWLRKKGHFVKWLALGSEIPDEWMNFPDTVVFSRTYPRDPLPFMRKYKKLGKRVIYEVDDVLWKVNSDNPSAGIATDWVHQYKTMMQEADAITTTTPYLAEELKKFSGNKNVFVCPNAIDYEMFHTRPNDKKELIIGYSGAASHWRDLNIITDALKEIKKKHEFTFVLQGMCGCPLEAELYGYQRILLQQLEPERKEYLETALKWFKEAKELQPVHVPFYPPELFPSVLRGTDIDIGLIPLSETEFDKSKSCLKFYEYASVGTVSVASDVAPYNKEVTYRAKNNTKDWVKKIEKLIVDVPFREKLLAEQQAWVKENRNFKHIVQQWERALDPK